MEFKSLNENTITLDGQQMHIIHELGINSSTFIDSYEELKKKFKLKITSSSFPVEITPNGNTSIKGKIPMMHKYATFIFYSSALDKEGIDIKHLVSQINKANDFDSVNHAESLSILAFIYHRCGKKIEFLPVRTNADLKIEGIKAELKVARPELLNIGKRRPPKVKKGRVDISNEIILEISKLLSAQLPKAIKQGEMIFFNLSDRRFFSSVGLPIPKLARIIEPKKYRIVFYETHPFTPNVNISHVWGKVTTELGKVTTPDIHQFKGTFLDVDPYLWNFLLYN